MLLICVSLFDSLSGCDLPWIVIINRAPTERVDRSHKCTVIICLLCVHLVVCCHSLLFSRDVPIRAIFQFPFEVPAKFIAFDWRSSRFVRSRHFFLLFSIDRFARNVTQACVLTIWDVWSSSYFWNYIRWFHACDISISLKLFIAIIRNKYILRFFASFSLFLFSDSMV